MSTGRIGEGYTMRVAGRQIMSTTISTGRFFCADEEADRSYRLVEARQFLILLSIPVRDLGVVSEYVQCTSCASTYTETALAAT